MEIHGTIAVNLRAAVTSAKRLHGQPVYRETLAYWCDLLDKARRARGRDMATDGEEVDRLVLQLEAELEARNPERRLQAAAIL
ncbi:hypothetical protein DMC47_36545 [Nostoc sp. 3335mG]|nr:hypothetical protein DMC47_36545 [Nostoc sp. 3335mG]